MNIPEEALTAASAALWGTDTSNAQETARRALEAAAPLIAAQVWEEGMTAAKLQAAGIKRARNPYIENES